MGNKLYPVYLAFNNEHNLCHELQDLGEKNHNHSYYCTGSLRHPVSSTKFVLSVCRNVCLNRISMCNPRYLFQGTSNARHTGLVCSGLNTCTHHFVSIITSVREHELLVRSSETSKFLYFYFAHI